MYVVSKKNSGAQRLTIRPQLVIIIYLFPIPCLASQACGWAVIIINEQKLILYYAVYDY